ncbi:DUF3570 domain-containing protein [Aliikangiella sp. G2MR2-5]|uniref:DUF3570 domain-containing protein n=1 Tax=Aliikangiella sp. G2MR2-5 TaxID=2788943 RepID=UPI0018AC8270|nr:DUF3570 domain-containing protein [Aliikangiella sp. G2MR2-5]
MQLDTKKLATATKPKNVASALTAASLALLGSAAKAEGDFWDFSKDWKFNTGGLYYGEQDRVTAVEGVFNATREASYNDKFSFKLVLDSLTGASPNGAVAQTDIQTFTRPSGRGQFDVAAGEIPLDDTFRDTRVQMNAQWTTPRGEDKLVNYGLHFSKEYDYLSVALNGGMSWDFYNKNSTLSAGLSIAMDQFEPEGRIPYAFAAMVIDEGQFANQDAYNQAFDATRRIDSDDKDTTDLLLGWTQIINRRTVMQFNYSYSDVSGYLTDPFKVVSVVDAQGVAQEHLYESRPDNRTKHSFFWQTKYHMDNSIADLSVRYMTDDWEIDSVTLEYKHHFLWENNSYLEPQFRWYQQSAADFYTPYLIEGQVMPEFASADSRLGEFSAITLGLKYGWRTQGGSDMALRLSLYQQTAEDVLSSHPGDLASLDIYPELTAVFLQYTYDF